MLLEPSLQLQPARGFRHVNDLDVNLCPLKITENHESETGREP